jgi:hypothetical protein
MTQWCVLMSLIPMATLHAQEDNWEVRVFVLKYVAADEISDIVSKTFRTHVAVDPRTNSLVVHGDQEALSQIEKLVSQIDIKIAPSADNDTIYQAKHRKAAELANVIDETFSRQMRVTFDRGSGTVILRGPEEELVEAMALLDRIDQAAPKQVAAIADSFTVTIDFIRGKLSTTTSGSLPPNLADVGRALQENGLGDLTHFGHVMARANEAEEFKTSGNIAGLDADMLASVYITGAAYTREQGSSVDLTIDARLSVPFNTSKGEHPHYQDADFSIGTSSTVPIGDYLVLGALPSVVAGSDTVVLVIRVTR